MSTTAYNSLSEEQRSILSGLTTILHVDISTIENIGGGSARCMITEVFLPKN